MVPGTHPTPPQVQKAGASLPVPERWGSEFASHRNAEIQRPRARTPVPAINPTQPILKRVSDQGLRAVGASPGSISVAALPRRCVSDRSVAPADRRIDRAIQIASLPRRTAPGNRSAAAWEIANALTVGFRPGRADELADDAQRLIVFLDARFEPADAGLLSCDTPSRQLGDGRPADQKCNDNRRQLSRGVHLSVRSVYRERVAA